MNWEPIDKESTLLYKGLAILMIVAHNFMHVFPRPRQNEFNFNRENFDSFLYLLANEPENILQIGFSYFGHFGVQVFIFLSTYGLTKKYLLNSLDYRAFIWSRLVKIYPAFLLSLVTWWVLRVSWYWLNGTLESADYMLDAVLLKILLISNFFPGYALKPVGPWWFFPFIIQFYLVYPAILKVYGNFGVKSLILISLLSLGCVISLQNIDFNFYYTFLPYVPVFLLGVYLANNDNEGIVFSKIYLFITLVVFVLGNLYKPFWYLTHFCSLVILMSVFKHIKLFITNTRVVNISLLFIGTISMQVFFVHGFLRTPLVGWAMEDNVWYMTNFYCSIYLLISLLIAFLLFKVEYKLRHTYRKYFT